MIVGFCAWACGDGVGVGVRECVNRNQFNQLKKLVEHSNFGMEFGKKNVKRNTHSHIG